MSENYQQAVSDGLEHARGHAADFFNFDKKFHPLFLIEEGRGNRDGCMRHLESIHTARAMVDWFGGHDIFSFKQDCYVASRLQYIRKKEANEFGVLWEQDFFTVLMSDHAPLINFWASFKVRSQQAIKEVSDLRKHFFRHYQMTLALRGEWEELGRRAQEQLDAQPAGLKRFMVDQRFYLALARGDKAGIEEALADLTSPKMAKVRNKQLEFGYTHFFIGTHATMYAKIAWRAGYEVEVDTPYIPKEWLPIQPLAKYEEPYAFMRAYDADLPTV
ncbi:Imm49 family immunity protein [Variovorax sp. PDC80]|uniref:Imm49 family immunity protein n=1 Tax=Variovorax sp. PDC80 TaxID=1882827 RepID=UPI000A865E5A|nr:Imm49 family immunity protein [Variovorax sp. PDC80]